MSQRADELLRRAEEHLNTHPEYGDSISWEATCLRFAIYELGAAIVEAIEDQRDAIESGQFRQGFLAGLRAARDAAPTRLRTITEDSWPIARQAITDYRAAIDALIRAQEEGNEA